MSAYESDPSTEPVRITTIASMRKQWRRAGTTTIIAERDDFLRELSAEAAR
ncbi:hypothetical protein FHW23_000111 [Curtobacterium pusillum]|uniref:Uncharacterized protein n=1 Tax=Curtobacterium pusillum TaxID=69373 RepID=A0AAW3T2M9_9MICO|nr:hypothetical protein [Curtobacterium pusillum]MBA8988879.1 hypothetical protein [Curtobacterium pusillum]